MRDRLDGLCQDEDFAGWYPRDGRPGLSPAQLATVCVLQFVLGLSDRQAAEAVRCRIDFKYALDSEPPSFADASAFDIGSDFCSDAIDRVASAVPASSRSVSAAKAVPPA